MACSQRSSAGTGAASAAWVLGLLLAGCSGSIDDGEGASGSAGGSTGTAGAASPGAGGPIGSAGLPGSSGGAGGGVSGVGGNSSPAGGSAGTSATTGGSPPEACEALTDRRLRRLSRREYANVVADLLGEAFRATVMTSLPDEPVLDGLDNQDSALFVEGTFQAKLADAAEKIAKAIDPAKVAPCATAAGSAACLTSFTASFAKQAYGRPLEADEAARLATVAALGENYAASVRLVVETVLQSPNFLYLSELGPATAPATPGRPIPLTQYEVASQLSFLLRGSRPTAELLGKAEKNALATPEALLAEAELMLRDARASTELTRFLSGWLDLPPVATAPKSPTAFPELTPAVVTAMQQEIDQFLAAHLKGGDGTIREFLTERSTNIPPALLPIYGADYTATTGLNPARRVGVLSLPGVLTYHASYGHSGPVERGLFVRRQLLCDPVPAPPQDVLDDIAMNPIDPDDTQKTTRQKFEMHLDEQRCAACHQFFDPIGFGLEQMDGIGRYRTTENGLPVDSKGNLASAGPKADGPFEGVAELSTKLAESENLQACVSEHFFRFAQSRPATAEEACIVDAWTARFSRGGGRLRDLVHATVTHRTFANRMDDR